MAVSLLFYKALAEETRLKSLLLLESQGELCVCDLMNALALSQPKVSRHLAELRKQALVVGERRGKWMYYRINPDLPSWMKQVLSITLESNRELIAPLLVAIGAESSSCQT
ncbi:metalloregulator ArsR/SmtB family transcription factor [Vibrio hepatarius]|uniref:metalloregulator ArsR/SmtB family transcription factor n=1 Tax=Vibrio hepatarius TaxID=171383 RepID=UPI00148CEC51|nr:metalloregulator ArsR/SmtB family transcription factor [Vibrio hepatarius]NOI13577.1 metalloregulator ArsR/SmtB family transcription factor [Vibrio hepatarius]